MNSTARWITCWAERTTRRSIVNSIKKQRLVTHRALCYNALVGRKGLRRAPRNAYRSEVISMSDFELIMIALTVLSIVVDLLKDK